MFDESLIKKLKRLKISADIFSDYHDVKDKYITSFEKLEFIKDLSKFRYKIIDELSDSIGELYAIEAKFF